MASKAKKGKKNKAEASSPKEDDAPTKKQKTGKDEAGDAAKSDHKEGPLCKSECGSALGYTVAYVDDMEACTKFYTTLFGFKIRNSAPGIWTEFDTGTTSFALHKVDKPELRKSASKGKAVAAPAKTNEALGALCTYWFTPDLPKLHAKFVELGLGTVVKEPTKEPWGGYKAEYLDPSGCPVSVMEKN